MNERGINKGGITNLEVISVSKFVTKPYGAIRQSYGNFAVATGEYSRGMEAGRLGAIVIGTSVISLGEFYMTFMKLTPLESFQTCFNGVGEGLKRERNRVRFKRAIINLLCW